MGELGTCNPPSLLKISGSEATIKGVSNVAGEPYLPHVKEPTSMARSWTYVLGPPSGPILTLTIDGQLAKVTCNVITWTRGWPSTQPVSGSRKKIASSRHRTRSPENSPLVDGNSSSMQSPDDQRCTYQVVEQTM